MPVTLPGSPGPEGQRGSHTHKSKTPNIFPNSVNHPIPAARLPYLLGVHIPSWVARDQKMKKLLRYPGLGWVLLEERFQHQSLHVGDCVCKDLQVRALTSRISCPG